MNIANKLLNRPRRSPSRSELQLETDGLISIAFDPQYDSIVRDYYLYCVAILKEELFAIEHPCNVIIGPEEFEFNNAFRTFRIIFQIEHTLVKSGGRDTASAPNGIVKVSEQGDETYLVRLVNQDALMKADAIIDYSRPNVWNVQSCGLYPEIAEKTFPISPLIYSPHRKTRNRSLDCITVFGDTKQPRRSAFLMRANSKTPTENINNVFSNIDEIYGDTKILLNIHQTDHHHTVEELRILPALLCGAVVISEVSPLTNKLWYDEHIIWAKIEDMPDLAAWVLQNYTEVFQKAFGLGFSRTVERLAVENQGNARKIAKYFESQLSAPDSGRQQ